MAVTRAVGHGLSTRQDDDLMLGRRSERQFHGGRKHGADVAGRDLPHRLMAAVGRARVQAAADAEHAPKLETDRPRRRGRRAELRAAR